MVHMSGMPVAPQRDATFSKGALGGGSFGPAAGAAFRPPAPAEEAAAPPPRWRCQPRQSPHCYLAAH